MAKQSTIRIANDNAPSYLEHHIKPALNSASTDTQAYIPSLLTSEQQPLKLETTRSLNLTLICLIAAIFMGMGTFFLGLGTAAKILASLSLLWAGLWSSYVSADHGHWRLSEISVVAALTGLIGATATTANYLGLNLTLSDGLMLMSILPILLLSLIHI